MDMACFWTVLAMEFLSVLPLNLQDPGLAVLLAASGLLIIAAVLITALIIKMASQVNRLDRRLQRHETWLTSASTAPDSLVNDLRVQLREQTHLLTEAAALVSDDLGKASEKIEAANEKILIGGRTALNDARTLEQVLATRLESITAVSKALDEVREAFSQELDGHVDKFKDGSEVLVQSAQTLSESTVLLEEGSVKFQESVADSLDRYSQSRSELLAANKRFSDELAEEILTTRQQADMARDVLSTAGESLSQSRQQLVEEARTMTTGLQEQQASLEAAAAQASEAGLRAGEHLDEKMQEITVTQEQMSAQGLEVLQKLEDILVPLKATIEQLLNQGDELETRLFSHSEEASAKLAEASEKFAGGVGTILTEADGLSGKLGERAEAMDALDTRIQDRMAHLQDLHTREEELGTTLEAQTGRMSELITGFEKERTTLVDLVSENGARLQTFSDQAVSIVQRLSDELARRSEEIEQRLTESHNMLAEGGGDFSSRAGQLTAAARESGESLEKFNELLDQYSERLTTSSITAGQQLSDHQDHLGRQSEGLAEIARTISNDLAELETRFQKARDNLSAAQASVSQDWNDLGGQLQLQLSDVQEIDAHLQAQLAKASEGLGSQRALLEESIQLADSRLTSVVQDMRKEVLSLSHLSDSLVEKARANGNVLLDESARLQTVSERSLRNAMQIKDHYEKESRDLFNRTSRHIIEDLNSISIDLTRALDGEVPEADWRRYIKGDRTIFSRNLLRNRQDALVRQIGERIRLDAAMRGYVTRYVELFDQLLQGAAKSDSENLLHATFLTSDVGKLYIILSKSLGRED